MKYYYLFINQKYHRTSTAKLYLDRSVADHVINVKLEGRDSAYAAGAPARGALLAEGRCCAEIVQQYNI